MSFLLGLEEILSFCVLFVNKTTLSQGHEILYDLLGVSKALPFIFIHLDTWTFFLGWSREVKFLPLPQPPDMARKF